MVISGTNHGDYVIKNYKETPQTRLILDLCVPRSVHPDMQRHPALTLLNIEQLCRFVQGEHQNQWQEVVKTKEKIAQAVEITIASYEKKVSSCVYT